MNNIIDFPDTESCCYTEGASLGVQNKHNGAIVCPYEGVWFIFNPSTSLPIEFKSRKELAEWLWMAVRLVDSEGRYEKDEYVGLNYDV